MTRSNDSQHDDREDWHRRRPVAILAAMLIVLAIGVAFAVDTAPAVREAVSPVSTPATTSPAKVHGLVPSVEDHTLASAMTTLVFSDEFDGTTLDSGKWNTGRYAPSTSGDAPFNPLIESAYYSSSQVTVSNGNVHLTLRPSIATIEGKTYSYASGLIQSEHHFSLTPGTYVESRIKADSCSGCWDAFWAQPARQWPPEIDIFEFFQPESTPKYNFHPLAGGESGVTDYGEPGASYLDQYHTYGLYWDGVDATPYLDGKPYATQPADTQTAMYLIFNLTVYAGHSPATGSEMSIDWVRVWR